MSYFYEVFVAGQNYHGDRPLTYSSEKPAPVGQLVYAPLRNSKVLGLIRNKVEHTTIKAKSLDLLPLPAVPSELIKLIDWMSQYYPASLGSISQLFMPPALTQKSIDKLTEIKIFDPQINKLPILTAEQAKALDDLKVSGTNVLHGETGSGKTRLYLELATSAIQNGKSVVILSPEIGLSSQLFNNFSEIFGNRTIIFHSNLTPAERRTAWLRVLTCKEPLVIIGARSALFVPLRNIGLVVVDEAHDSAFKQDQAPYYNAIRVAGKLSQLHQATLIFGSATPNVTDYYIATQRLAPVLRLNKPAISSNFETNIDVIDIKDRSKFNRSAHLSDDLLKSINVSLEKNEQILLFLNRRGTARSVICQQCGWQALCPHCDTAMVYHGDSFNLICHVCNYRSNVFSSCPECGSVEILFKSAGTKAIAEEVQKLFPSSIVQRFDADNLKSERFEQHYKKIRDGEVDILVGTQTLAKGLDLPRLSLVGVITADSSLFIPDYLSQERTYQLISQVIGRVGRGHRHGKVVIQTYEPKSTIIKNVLDKNWNDFYQKELELRRQFMFPPFCYLLKLTCRRASSASAQKTAQKLADQIQNQYTGLDINGPAPAFHEKLGNKYEWQLILKSKSRSSLVEIITNLPSGWSSDIDPINLL